MSKKPNRFGANLGVDLNDPAALTSVGGSVAPVEPTGPEIVVEEVQEPIQENTSIWAGLEQAKPTGKSCSFYLFEDNIAKLERLAKKNKCSMSKLLNILIKNAPEN